MRNDRSGVKYRVFFRLFPNYFSLLTVKIIKHTFAENTNDERARDSFRHEQDAIAVCRGREAHTGA